MRSPSRPAPDARQHQSPNGRQRSSTGTTTRSPRPSRPASANSSTHSPRPPRLQPEELAEAARAFEGATRSHIRAERSDNGAIRSAARGVIRTGNALGKGEDGGTTAMLLSTMLLVTIAAVTLALRPRSRPAGSRRPTSRTTPVQRLPISHRCPHGRDARARPSPSQTLTRVVRWHLRNRLARAGRLRTHRARLGRPRRHLDQAERAGHDTGALLQQAIGWCELDAADGVTDVLAWRLRCIGELPPRDVSAVRCPARLDG